MSEAELHILRGRLLGGIRNKAARGELRRGLPVGFVWGEKDGEVRFHPDESVRAAIGNVFARFAELGSARRVWLHLRSEGLSFPLQTHYGAAIRWVDPSYIAIYHVLTNPVYAGAYAYGKSRFEVTLDTSGQQKKRVRKLPVSEWSVLIRGHHEVYIDWSAYELLVAGFSIAAKSMASRYNNAVCGDIDRGERNSNCFEGRNDEKPEMAMDSDEFEFRAVPAICLTASEHRQPGPGAETALA